MSRGVKTESCLLCRQGCRLLLEQQSGQSTNVLHMCRGCENYMRSGEQRVDSSLPMLVEHAPEGCAHGAGYPFSLLYGPHSAAVLGLCWEVTGHTSFL